MREILPKMMVWEVGPLIQAVGDLISARFGAVVVRGELSGWSRAPSGHCYFTLKAQDGRSGLRCAMFRRAAGLLDFAPADGQLVEVGGRLAVYEARGELQLVVESMRRAGVGALMEQFLRLKARLEAEGLFDPARKRVLPAFPRRIGVITSPAAAAWRDVLTALARRSPQVEVILYPALVQGSEAPASLVAALACAGRRAEVDTLILCRGGGSLEDLWAFNDERVVRAVAACPLPVVCGVGHETDVSLCDFAADLRAATPTAAAELAAPPREDCLRALDQLARRLRQRMRDRLDRDAQRLDQLTLRLVRPAGQVARHRASLSVLDQRRRAALGRQLETRRQAWERLSERLPRVGRQITGLARTRLDLLSERLRALSPERVLARGYAWVSDERGQALTSVAQVRTGQRLRTQWVDGSVESVVLQAAAATPALRARAGGRARAAGPAGVAAGEPQQPGLDLGEPPLPEAPGDP